MRGQNLGRKEMHQCDHNILCHLSPPGVWQFLSCMEKKWKSQVYPGSSASTKLNEALLVLERQKVEFKAASSLRGTMSEGNQN